MEVVISGKFGEDESDFEETPPPHPMLRNLAVEAGGTDGGTEMRRTQGFDPLGTSA